MSHVKIYSTSWCAFCRAEKQFLAAQGIKFEDVNVEENQQAAQEMIGISGQTGVPFTVITHKDGSRVGILGFDRPRLAHELGLK